MPSEVCVPLLEKGSGLGNSVRISRWATRPNASINDSEHTFSNTAKIVSANDGQALDEVARVYASRGSHDLCRASGIQVAEAAKMTRRTCSAVSTSP